MMINANKLVALFRKRRSYEKRRSRYFARDTSAGRLEDA